jgi:hypothetical protein
MQIFTVTHCDRPVAVVRARHAEEAIDAARDMAEMAAVRLPQDDAYDAREPDDAEMVGWLERRDDYLLVEHAAA